MRFFALTIEYTQPASTRGCPDTNHELLSNLSQSTGGEVITPAELTKVRELLPNRGVRLIGTPEEETLWDTPLALILLLVLVTFEWVGRRLIRLA